VFFSSTVILQNAAEVIVKTIDYRCEDKKQRWKKGDIGAIRKALTPSFKKSQSPPAKKDEPFSQEMQLKISLLSQGFEIDK
jgi:hypothetical protein